MVNNHFKVIWARKATEQLKQAYLYIRKDSFQNAEKVRKEILEATEKLAVNPELNPPDKYKINNDNSFRAFELFRYRVSYKITNAEVIIVRIRHTSMSPKNY
ncbi:type II toxin-antitoxin system RelE/ParE family toxin [Segetibacter aerophilus]|uniref:Plasmid stabilization protein n=1 Tax=Segetibacter aerophilus TaxID=670293 RepID=A0A512BFG9_9BACT|nr:type II toxin-antitoxin system RelE/ParE family toxin [Segetibacter aerophilus]GEO10719.1 hypothetical protein SAE01_32150 [Segetibacter aerophilus]